jgi:lipopolysaccharide biosynthesis glycosyltransferase
MDLIYYTVGYSDEYIKLIGLSIYTLRKSGYTGDIAILCDESFLSKCMSILGNQVIYKTFLNSTTPEHASMNKLRIFELSNIHQYSRVLFLDSDILVHMNIYSLLDGITRPDILYVYTETQKQEDHKNLMWGLQNYSTFELDTFKKNNTHVFNAGCFAFLQSETMRNHFLAIQHMIIQWNGRFFYEQSFMNAYFNRNNQTDRTLLTDVNYIFPPKEDKPYPNSLLHFAGDPGNGNGKFNRMYQYIVKHFDNLFQITMNQSIIDICIPYTMISKERLAQNIESIRIIENEKIPGDIVEIGVWKGGSIMAMLKQYELYKKTERIFHLFDTFTGMTDPSDDDFDLNNKHASSLLSNPIVKAQCSLDIVQTNLRKHVQYDWNRIQFHEGDIRNTKVKLGNIAVLRLDTDFYDSTRFELDTFYPLVSPGGIVLIDDYGHWKGCRKAVDEFLVKHPELVLHTIDYTGVYFRKPY